MTRANVKLFDSNPSWPSCAANRSKKYEDLMDDVETLGYRPSHDDATAEAREKLHCFFKPKLPRQTKDMLNEALSGISLPPHFLGGDAADKSCTFW